MRHIAMAVAAAMLIQGCVALLAVAIQSLIG